MVTLSGNNALDNYYNGIRLNDTSNITLSGNTIANGGIVISGSSLGVYASHAIDSSNTVNGKPIYYHAHRSGLGSGNFSNAGQVILVNCTGSVVSGLDVSGGSIGIALYYSNNILLLSNNASCNNAYGIYLSSSSNNTISGNNVFNNYWYGIYLSSSNINTISGNNASSNIFYGIYLSSSSNIIISGNTFSDNHWDGIEVAFSNGSTISGNNASNNHQFGISLYRSSNTVISGNFFSGNQVSQATCYGGTGNAWDNGTHGNYWGDYTTHYPCSTNDGVTWNTPYKIDFDGRCQDNHPLVIPGTVAGSCENPGYMLYALAAFMIAAFMIAAIVLTVVRKRGHP